jgi:hypothetical protein
MTSHRLTCGEVNPDKLFDYLDGRLSPAEREALERQLVADEQLQRELAMARRIHAGMPGNSREVLLEPEIEISERGRKLARPIGVAFIILMAANVGAGLWFIARHETKNPNRALLEAQMRDQLRSSLEHTAATELNPGKLAVTDVKIVAAPGDLDRVAREVVDLVQRLGGSASKGIPDEHRVGVLVELPSALEIHFRAQAAAIPGVRRLTGESTGGSEGKKSFPVQIVDQPTQ